MATKLIGIKEFRKDISGFARKAQESGSRYVIMNRNTPIFELKPYGKNTDLESIFENQSKAPKMKKQRTPPHKRTIRKIA